jgi:hypothetical protein
MGVLEVVAAGGPYFAGFILRNFVLSMFLAALALAIGPTSLGDVDLWMAKVSALSANEHDGTAAAHWHFSAALEFDHDYFPYKRVMGAVPALHIRVSRMLSRGVFRIVGTLVS